MAERLLERALNRASATVAAYQEQVDPVARQEKQQKYAEDELRKAKEGMTAADAIQRILLAYKDKDYFRCDEGKHGVTCHPLVYVHAALGEVAKRAHLGAGAENPHWSRSLIP
jgi:hypothetical protein